METNLGNALITVFPKQPQPQFHSSNYRMTPHVETLITGHLDVGQRLMNPSCVK